MIKISASILSANFRNLEKEISALESAGADMIHIDVMDGIFVPNLTFGPMILQALKKLTKLPLDVHLMLQTPEISIESYINSGADIITIHPESTMHVDRTLSIIKQHNIKAGLALLPSTSPEIVDYLIDKLDLILVMTVNPGFAGQKFLANQLHKIEILSHKIKLVNKNIMLSVDGGINHISAKQCVQAGANTLVSGSFIFTNQEYDSKITALKLI